MRRALWAGFSVVALLLVACGSDSATSASDGASGSSSGSGSNATGKRLNGSVCSLLTATEAEAAIRTGVALNPTEGGGGRDEDRTCSYIMQGVGAPALVISLQGEREAPSSLADLRAAYPRAANLQVRGAEALLLDSSGPSFVLQKNGLAAFVQPVAWPQNETIASVASRLAQPIADRLP